MPFPVWFELTNFEDIQAMDFGPMQAEHFVDLLAADSGASTGASYEAAELGR